MRYENNTSHFVKWCGVLFLVTFFVISWLILYKVHRPEKPVFSTVRYSNLLSDSISKDTDNSRVLFTSELIPELLPVAHASSLEVLPDGKLITFWFAGSREGAADVKIWQAVYDGDKWSGVTEVISPQQITYDTKRFTKKVGNPVVYLSTNGNLHLFVVSVGLGGWSGSSLNHFISYDNGITWGKGQKLFLSPIFNISTLDRTSAVTLRDGGFYLPVYHELILKYPEILRFDKDGNFINQMRLNSYTGLLQPTVLPISELEAYVYLRNFRKNDDKLYYEVTKDGGVTWSAPKATNLTNQNSSIVVAQVDKSKYLMVHNPTKRDKLFLAISNDGVKWTEIYLLEDTHGSEFSYPSIQAHGDIVDIVYTWKRKNIKHVRFNKAWLNQKSGELYDEQ